MQSFFVREFTNNRTKVIFSSYILYECEAFLEYAKAQNLIKGNNKKYDIVDENGCSIL